MKSSYISDGTIIILGVRVVTCKEIYILLPSELLSLQRMCVFNLTLSFSKLTLTTVSVTMLLWFQIGLHNIINIGRNLYKSPKYPNGLIIRSLCPKFN